MVRPSFQLANIKPIGFIYLVHPGNLKVQGTHVYKVGRTIDLQKRIPQYPMATRVLLAVRTLDPNSKERCILQRFRSDFEPRTDYGREYFAGDPADMQIAITQTLGITPLDSQVVHLEDPTPTGRSSGRHMRTECIIKAFLDGLVLGPQTIPFHDFMLQLDTFCRQQDIVFEWPRMTRVVGRILSQTSGVTKFTVAGRLWLSIDL